jgi:hypothetical protein
LDVAGPTDLSPLEKRLPFSSYAQLQRQDTAAAPDCGAM